ncbi:MAG: response regulator transcription factor [Anaerolineaceae bacterium]|nr:response regulator transcription factor [Anaerolineaceae bacterium]
MSYKVFLVEDEIVAREGIRDNVNWQAAGFEFCGEAPDGEIALPLIQKSQPDVIITDIKMPFMDGLQLCKLVRQQMPWVKIIILSGHDEFDYAQSAIKLGVTEYLLKPISAREIQSVLQSVATALDQETEERENLQELQSQIKDVLALQRERLLLQLVVGGVSSTAAIEQCRQIGLDIIAQHYLVILIKVHLHEDHGPVDFGRYHEIQRMAANVVNKHSGAFFTQKSVEELLLIMTGEDAEQLKQDGLFLAGLVQQDIEAETGYRVAVGVGSVEQRLTDIYHSFAAALTAVTPFPANKTPCQQSHLAKMLKLETSAVEQYLKSGLINDFDAFFATHLQPLGEAALQSTLIKHYLFVDLILTAAQIVTALDGEANQVIPVMDDIEGFLANIKTIDQMRQAVSAIFSAVLSFRNNQAQYEKAKLIFQAKAFIDNHFTDPNLLLNEVAATVNLSPSHFSVVFGRETGESFKDYLTRVRIERAKELLRTTSMKCSEVAYQSGYNDPHYFSYVFRKSTGLPPQQFRQLPQI